VTVPSPMAVDGETTHDPATNSLLVKVSGVGARFWRQGHEALLKAEESGSYWSAPPVVSASAPGRRQIARGEPVGGGWLRFKLSDADYRRLAGSQDLGAIVTVDQEAGHILGVKFRHRGVT
jgi:hypothetical protein